MRGVAVVGAEFHLPEVGPGQLPQRAQLVLGQGLGGEEVEGVRSPIADESLQDGHVVAEGLAAGGGGSHYHVLAGPGGVDGLSLVDVELLRPRSFEGVSQGGWQWPIQPPIACPPGGDVLRMSDLTLVESLPLEMVDEVLDPHGFNFTTKGQKKRLKDMDTHRQQVESAA